MFGRVLNTPLDSDCSYMQIVIAKIKEAESNLGFANILVLVPM